MSLHRRNPRRDSNEASIVQPLERIGRRVVKHSAKGEPDLFVLMPDGVNWRALEVKREKGKLTAAQEADMRGVVVVRSIDDALIALGYVRAR